MLVIPSIFTKISGSMAGTTFKKRYNQTVAASKISKRVYTSSPSQLNQISAFSYYRTYVSSLSILVNNSFKDQKRRRTSGNMFDLVNYSKYDKLTNFFNTAELDNLLFSNKKDFVITFIEMYNAYQNLYVLRFSSEEAVKMLEGVYYHFVILLSQVNRIMMFARILDDLSHNGTTQFYMPTIPVNDYVHVYYVSCTKDLRRVSNQIYAGKILIVN